MNERAQKPTKTDVVLILGSGRSVVRARDWARRPFDQIVAINNAWAVRHDWDYLVYPEDFPPDRLPVDRAPEQKLVDAKRFVPAQNRYGGFVFAGGTMAFTAAYWALDVLRPKVLAFLGCDMVYPAQGNTHFYGKGTADPLRKDISLRDLGAKSARLAMVGLAQGCACVNLSDEAESALLFERASIPDLQRGKAPLTFDRAGYDALRAAEAALGYDTPTGLYWQEENRFDPAELDQMDVRWRQMFAKAQTLGATKDRFTAS